MLGSWQGVNGRKKVENPGLNEICSLAGRALLNTGE